MFRSPKVVRCVVVLFVCGGLSCAAVNQLNLLTTQDEIEIGRQAAREVERELPMYQDPVVAAYIDSLGQVLVRHSTRADLTYHFRVVDTEEVNAFALPGGGLYMNIRDSMRGNHQPA